MSVRLEHGDCLDVMRRLAAEGVTVDSVVTDPPYHLTSIVKRFGGANAAPAKHGTDGAFARASRGFMGKQWDGGDIAFRPETWALAYDILPPGGHLLAFSGTRTYHRMVCAIDDAGFEIRDQLAWVYGSGFPKSHDVAKGIDAALGAERPVIGRERLSNDIRGGALLDVAHGGVRPAFERDITAAGSPEAKKWQGWGTALKPAWEPVVMARKPLHGTVAGTVLAYGTGALNIDGCRVEAERLADARPVNGRWPANVLHDGSDEVLAAFPAAPGQQRSVGHENGNRPSKNCYGDFGPRSMAAPRGDMGSAARFFYSAKADAADRLSSKHPTVKPIDLMAWLCRLVTPPGGTVLDPFAGSGSTGMACLREGFNTILIEREAEYVADIRRRIAHVSGGDTPLFAESAE